MASIPCGECGSKCCKYVALPITGPKSAESIDNIRWYLHHKNVNVFINNENVWHIEFVTNCSQLGKDGRCMAYEERPDICRVYGTEHDTGECEYVAVPFKECFTQVEEFDKWLANRRSKRKMRR